MAIPAFAVGSFFAQSEHSEGLLGQGGPSTFAMAGLNAGWCAKFQARDNRDIKSLNVNWSSVATPGTVQLRIETIDMTTQPPKPTGTLYDANAVKSFTPVAGWQNVAFDTLPTAGLTAGNLYGALLITTGAGTTQTLNAYIGGNTARHPFYALTAADASTRANLTEQGVPIATIVYEDDDEDELFWAPLSARTSFDIYGTRAVGHLYTFDSRVKLSGMAMQQVQNTTDHATMTGDIQLHVYDANGAVVTGPVVIDKEHFGVAFSTKRLFFEFPSPIVFNASTYRFSVSQSDTGSTSGNAYTVYGSQAKSAAHWGGKYYRTHTLDRTANPITWVDTTDQLMDMWGVMDNLFFSGSYSGPWSGGIRPRAFGPGLGR